MVAVPAIGSLEAVIIEQPRASPDPVGVTGYLINMLGHETDGIRNNLPEGVSPRLVWEALGNVLSRAMDYVATTRMFHRNLIRANVSPEDASIAARVVGDYMNTYFAFNPGDESPAQD